MSKFNEELAGAFYDLFRSTFSTSMNQNQVDALHANTLKLSNLILAKTEKVALEKVKRVNDATMKAFALTAQEVERVEAKLDAVIETLRTTLTILRETAVSEVAELASGGEADEEV